LVENFKPVEEPKVIEKYKLFEEFKVIETNEPVVNEVVDLKPIENKEMEITLRHDDFLETSSEVKFTSMALKNFPIKYRNFSKDLEPLKTNFLGITDVDFGNVRLEGISIKILDFLDFKLIEFRKKDFRIAIDDLRLYRYKNLSSAKNTFFELDLLDKSNSVEEANTWINAEIKSVIDVNIGDSLTIKRLHKMNFNDFPYDVEEIITLVHPLTKEEVKDNIIKLTRKSVKIKLRRVHK